MTIRLFIPGALLVCGAYHLLWIYTVKLPPLAWFTPVLKWVLVLILPAALVLWAGVFLKCCTSYQRSRDLPRFV